MAESGNDKQGKPVRLEKPDPAGYFSGESMTRRNMLTVGVQAVGGIAGLAIVLPAIGFAGAPLFEEESEPWQAVGPISDFSPEVGISARSCRARFALRILVSMSAIGSVCMATSSTWSCPG